MANANFTDAQLDAIWNKAKNVSDNPDIWRKDVAGAWIRRDCYGKTNEETNYGWEVDHIKPLSRGGKTELANLRPLQHANNRSKSDDYPVWTSTVTSNGDHNVRREQRWREP